MGSTAPDAFFADSPLGLALLRHVEELVARAAPDTTVTASKSQVAFRRRRGFAYLWRPSQYLKNPGADVVLSIALKRCVTSTRFKEVAHPAPNVWMHHLEIRSLDDVDDEVEAWLLEAAGAAGAAG